MYFPRFVIAVKYQEEFVINTTFGGMSYLMKVNHLLLTIK